MNIRSIPDGLGELEHYNVEYEREHFRYSDANRRVAVAVRDMFLGWFLPAPLRHLGEPAIYAMLDEPLLEAFGFPKPSLAMRRLVEGALKMRARVMRLLPERHKPRLRTGPRRPTYPTGYRIEELGPPLDEGNHLTGLASPSRGAKER